MPDSLYAARLSFQDGTAVTGLIVAVVCIAVFSILLFLRSTNGISNNIYKITEKMPQNSMLFIEKVLFCY